MEKFNDIKNDGKLDQNDKNTRIHLLRHSKASYKSYGEVLSSDNPQDPINIEKQLLPDIHEAGVDLANKEAEKLFAEINPDKEALFFVSSNQSRALETAKIYKDIAKTKGFTIIKPEHHRNPLSEKMNEEEIRIVKALSLKSDNSLWNSIYNPPAYLPLINWSKIDEETKQKWEEARQIIINDDKGSWGANYSYYSDLLKERKFLPHDQNTAKELFKTQFSQLLRLAHFGSKKAQDGFEGKGIRIIAVGHENYMVKSLEKYFKEEGMNNCEVIDVDVNSEDQITIARRNKSIIIEK